MAISMRLVVETDAIIILAILAEDEEVSPNPKNLLNPILIMIQRRSRVQTSKNRIIEMAPSPTTITIQLIIHNPTNAKAALKRHNTNPTIPTPSASNAITIKTPRSSGVKSVSCQQKTVRRLSRAIEDR
jgi:hypothetical protein